MGAGVGDMEGNRNLNKIAILRIYAIFGGPSPGKWWERSNDSLQLDFVDEINAENFCPVAQL